MKSSQLYKCSSTQLSYYLSDSCQSLNDVSVLFLHGFGGCSLLWEEAIEYLELQNWCSIDLLGHGQSNSQPLIDVFQLYDSLHCFLSNGFQTNHNITLISHSLAGMISLTLLRECHRLFKNAILISIDSKILFHPAVAEFARCNYYNPEFITAGLSLGISRSGSETILYGFQELKLADQTEDFLRIKDWLPEEVANITVPCLFVSGAEDKVLSPRRTRNLANIIPSAEYITLQNAGHYPFLEQTPLFCDSIKGYLP